MIKNKVIPVLLVTIIVITSFCSSAKEGYHIKVNVSGIKDTTSLLAYYFGANQYVYDTVEVNSEGYFEFMGEDKLDRGMYMIVLPGDKFFDIIVDKQQHFEIKTSIEDLVESIEFTNSPQNQSFYNYLSELKPIGNKMEELRDSINITNPGTEGHKKLIEDYEQLDEQINNKKSEYIESFPKGLFTAILKAQKDVPLPEQKLKPDGTPDRQALYNQYLKDYWQNIDLTDERLLRTPVYHQKLNHFFNSVVIQTPDSIISAADKLIEKTRPNDEMFKYTVWYVMNLSEKSKLMGMDALFVHMAENYYLTGDAFWISDEYKEKIAGRTEVLKPLLIGSVAPNIKVYKPEKESYALHDVNSKYTVLYFWDSECSHCKKVSPALYEVYQNNKEKGLKVFAMNVEMDREKWLNYLKENGFNDWINVHDPANQSGFRDKYDIYSIPIIYLLDEDKKIVAKEITAKQVEELIDHLEGQEK